MQELIDRVIAEYLDAHPYLLSPQDAHDRCWFESAAFVDMLMAHGIDAELLSGFRFESVPSSYGVWGRVITGAHTVAQVGDVTYDWTIRQFVAHEEDAVPRVITVKEFQQEWEAI